MLGTLARSAAVIAAGQLYDAFGMSGPVTWSSVTGVAGAGADAAQSAPARVTHARRELGDDRGDLVGVRVGAEVVGARDRDDGACRTSRRARASPARDGPDRARRGSPAPARDALRRPGRLAAQVAELPHQRRALGTARLACRRGQALPSGVADQPAHEPLGGAGRIVLPGAWRRHRRSCPATTAATTAASRRRRRRRRSSG